MFYYYGAKRALAKHYPSPIYPVVVEPFAGSAQYAVRCLRLGLAEEAVLYDTDDRVIEMWQRLLKMSPAEVLELPDLVAGENTYDPLHFVVAASNSWGGLKRLKVTERMPGAWRRMKQNVAETLPYVQGRVTINFGDYTEAAINGSATYFVDPPYQVPTGTTAARGLGYRKGSNSASLDFNALGDWCRARSGQVIVCEQEGADWLPFAPLKDVLDSQGRMKTEVIWTGGIAS